MGQPDYMYEPHWEPGVMGLVQPNRRLSIRQTIASAFNNTPSKTTTIGKPPRGLLVCQGSYDGETGCYVATLTGYEFGFHAHSGVGAATGSGTLVLGRRVGELAGTSLVTTGGQGSGTGFHTLVGAEIIGLRGEVLWKASNAATTTSLALYVPNRPFYEYGALLVSGGRFRSGGAGGATAAISGGYSSGGPYANPILALGDGGLSTIYIWRYVNGTRPLITWTFARSTSCSAWAVIIR